MSYYESFAPSRQTFAERHGTPSEFDAALGLIVVSFQELEAVIDEAIAAHFGGHSADVAIVTAELPFKARVHVLGALAHSKPFVGQAQPTETSLSKLDELLGLCLFIEAERNRLLHSFWNPRHQADSTGLRLKRVSRKDGAREAKQVVSSGELVDVADYVAYLATMLEEHFGLSFGAADHW